MRAVLEFMTGARRGQKIVLPMGRSVSIGRTSWAELVCEDDDRMSKAHFYLKLDDYACYLRDNHSRNGTFVNGVRIDDCIIRSGDTILAGNTKFTIQIEGDNPQKARELTEITWIGNDVPLEEQLASRGELRVPFQTETCESGLTLCRGPIDKISPATLATVLSPTWPLHLIVDLGRLGAEFPPELGEPQYLFDWLPPESAKLASPVVISAGKSAAWKPILNEGWGQDGVIAFFSKLPPPELLAKLRGLCRPKNANGQPRQGMFGYCWPCVLAPVLMQSPGSMVNPILDNVEAILVELPDLPESWQLFGNESLPGVLKKSGFVPSQAGADTAANPPPISPTPSE
jgi:Inner membrane component of T3SS, cytoplasmic domain